MNIADPQLPVLSPTVPKPRLFHDATVAVDRLIEIYDTGTAFLRKHFQDTVGGSLPASRFRAFYPEIRLTTTSYAQTDSRLSFGHVAQPGTYVATITRPDLFRNYLIQQIELLIENHGVGVQIGTSDTPIPVHFAMFSDQSITVPQEGVTEFPLRDVFDVPDLNTTNDDIVNGFGFHHSDGAGAAGALHRPAHRLFAGAAVALHRHRARAFPEPRAVHQLPVLRRRVRGLCPPDAGRSRQRLHRLSSDRKPGDHRRRTRRWRFPPSCRRCRPIT